MTKKIKWVDIGERAYLPFSFSLNGSQNSKKYLATYGDFNVEDKALWYKMRFCWPEGEIESVANYQIDLYKKEGSKYLWSMAEKCESAGGHFLKKVAELAGVEIKDRQKRAASFCEIMEEFRKFVVFMTIPWALEDFFGREMHRILSKRELKERVEIEKKLNQPIKQNEGELEQVALLEIAVSMRNDNDFSATILKKIEHHLDDYSWLPMRWLLGRQMDEGEVINRLRTVRQTNFREKLDDLKEQSKRVKLETGEIFDQLYLDDEEKELFWILKEYVYIRTFRSDLINKAFSVIMPILVDAAEELTMAYEDILFLSYQEIINCLDNEDELEKINIAERKKSWLLYREGEKITVLSGKAAEEFARQQGIFEEVHSEQTEVRGNTGYGGIISGRVKIVINPNDTAKVEKGDILIAVMTFPSYIMAMERASAFVTDEGGVLCHAAIVAREMKKPCVIGTKNATKIFKDGNLVEVDADKGIVRKITQ